MTSDTPDSLWRATCRETVAAPPLDADCSADLAVIGGGFTGCSAALRAAQAGASVCLLEAAEIGHGGSGRNVGLVNAGLWLTPDKVVAAMGEAAGRRLLDVLAGGPDAVFRRIEALGIDCEPTRAGTLHVAHAPAGLRALQDRLRQGNRLGAPLRLLAADEARRRIGAAGVLGALFDPRAGTIQPLAYCRGLARAARKAGARIHAASPVSALAREGGAWRLASNGHRVTARAVLLATNAYHLGLAAPARPAFVPVGFSQFATDPLDDALRARILPRGEGCWDTAQVMNSYRVDGAGRLIVGTLGSVGAVTGRAHAGHARRLLRRLFPEAADVPFRHVWQGRIAMTSDHVPKLVAFGPDALACFGYSGRGIAPGTVFGAASADALLGGDPGDLPVPVVSDYAERFAGPRAAFYEAGAALVHALRRG